MDHQVLDKRVFMPVQAHAVIKPSDIPYNTCYFIILQYNVMLYVITY